jgi:hypothetical protein
VTVTRLTVATVVMETMHVLTRAAAGVKIRQTKIQQTKIRQTKIQQTLSRESQKFLRHQGWTRQVRS